MYDSVENFKHPADDSRLSSPPPLKIVYLQLLTTTDLDARRRCQSFGPAARMSRLKTSKESKLNPSTDVACSALDSALSN